MLAVNVGGRWGRATRTDRHADAVTWSATRSHDVGAAAQWGRGAVADIGAGSLRWGEVPACDSRDAVGWQPATAEDAATSTHPWGWVPAKDMALLAGWDHTIRMRDVRLRLIYTPLPAAKDLQIAAGHRRSNEYGKRYDAATALQDSLYIPGNGPLAFSLGGRPYFPGTSPMVFFDFRYEPETPAIQPTDSGRVDVRWTSARRLSLQARLPWGRARVLDGPLTGIAYPDYPGPVKPLPEPPPDPTILDTYMVMNTVNLVVLPSRTPIDAKNVKVSLDRDSFSWAFGADILTRGALDLVKPGDDGAREVELEINGWTWVVLVEGYSRNQRFPTEAYTIRGASRTQLLAAPYAPMRTGLNAAPLTARQAAEEQLLFTGFTLVWNALDVGPADWIFPAGAFSYQGQTPMQVIARIAETVGAMVRPSANSDVIEIRPSYVVPPWEWGHVDAPIDRILPPAMMTELSGDWTPQPAWNACYVSGTAHGVSMLVRRAGTAGDNPTPDVFDDWITGEEANRARGVHELSKGGNQEIVGFPLPLFPVTDDHGVGLVLPGMLCRVPEASGPWVGVCLAVDISAAGTGAVQVKQQLSLERHF